MTDTSLTAQELRGAEAIAAGHRANTGNPMFLPPALYDRLAAAGASLDDIRRVEAIPTTRTEIRER